MASPRIELNPFLIEPIVEKILSFLPTPDLGPPRLVCKLWNEVGDIIERNRQPVTISSFREAQVIYVMITKMYPKWGICSLTFSTFAMDFEVVRKILIHLKNTLTTLRLKSGFIEEENYHEFMRIVGGNLRVLELGMMHDEYYCHFPFFPVQKDNQNSPTEWYIFPKLRSLEYIGYLRNQWGSGGGSTFLSDVVKSCPHLVRLTINGMLEENPSKFDGLGGLSKLKYLHLNMMPMDSPKGRKDVGVTNNRIHCLKKLNLALQDIRVSNVHTNLDQTLFRDFLESQGETLECVFLNQNSIRATGQPASGRQYCNASMPAPFPLSLPKLTRLQVFKPFVRNLQHVFNSAPNLYSILLQFDPDVEWKSILPRGPICIPKTLNTLTLAFVDALSLQKISTCSTHLVRLCLQNCGDSHLPVIFDKFPNIKELTLMEGREKMTDAVLTGLEPEVLDKFRDALAKLGEEKLPFSKQLAEKIEKCQIQPGLGSLKKMRHLILDFTSPKQFILLWGFWNLNKMHTVNITGNDVGQNSELYNKFMTTGGRYANIGMPESRSFIRDDSVVISGSSARLFQKWGPSLTSHEDWKYDDDDESDNSCLISMCFEK